MRSPDSSEGSPAGSGAGSIRLQTPGLRWLLIVSGFLVILAGTQLFVFTERTDEYFAWTVVPPLSAGFLGAGYYAAAAMEWVAVRERFWVSARLVSVTILIFATLTLGVTLAHVDRFHFDGPTVGTIAVTWAWIAIYAGVPPLMAFFLVVQRRMAGGDPPRVARLPIWFKVVFGVHMAALIAVGVPMLAYPTATGDAVWPWQLTPLTGRAMAAWLLGLGWAGFMALWEDDWARLRPVATSFILLIGLQMVALIRYRADLNWQSPRPWAYVVFVLNLLFLGVVATRRIRATRGIDLAAAAG